jgi:hypothetical protein
VNVRVRSGARLARAEREAHTEAMHQDSLWVMAGYAAVFVTPWVVGILWLLKRTPGSGDSTPQPSMGERARSRMNLG